MSAVDVLYTKNVCNDKVGRLRNTVYSVHGIFVRMSSYHNLLHVDGRLSVCSMLR